MKKFIVLRGELLRAGITQEILSKMLGVSRGNVNEKLNGRAQFRLDEMYIIKHSLKGDMSLDELFPEYGIDHREDWEELTPQMIQSERRRRCILTNARSAAQI